MSTTGLQEWIYTGAGWALAVAGIAVLVWALFWDRARGRKRCPGCWYDMSGAVAVDRNGAAAFVCPECGRSVESERALGRTRRRWGWVAVAITLFPALPYSIVVARRARSEQWWALVPTTFAAVAIDPNEGTGGWAAHVVQKRIKEMWRWQVALAAMRDCRFGLVDPARVIRTRSIWPEGSTIEFHLQNDESLDGSIFSHDLWLTCQGEMRAAVMPLRYRGVPGTPVLTSFVGAQGPMSADGDSSVLFAPSMTVGERVVDLRLQERATCTGMTSPVSFEHRVPTAIRVVARGSFPMKAERSLELDARVRRSVSQDWSLGWGSTNPVWLDFDFGLRPSPAFGLKIELLHRGALVGTGKLRASDASHGSAHIVTEADAETQLQQLYFASGVSQTIWRQQLTEWSIRMVGDLDLSLCDFDADSYWAGSVEMTLAEVMEKR